VTAGSATTQGPARALGRFLEIQTLGLNLSFALAFLLLASNGRPSWWTVLWIVVAFVAARNAGHSFNRWADRHLDAANPRTRERALVTGRYSPRFALSFCAANAIVLVVVAYLLNPLAFVLAPVALLIVLGYSYTKRVTSFTTAFLGLVQAVTPAAVYIAVTGTLPLVALVAVFAMLAWGTAFETIHSLGDVESDRALGLFSVPVRWGSPPRSASCRSCTRRRSPSSCCSGWFSTSPARTSSRSWRWPCSSDSPTATSLAALPKHGCRSSGISR